MSRALRQVSVILATALALLVGTQCVSAQGVVMYPANVSYYYPAPTVTYASPPVVYSPVQQVSYYTAPTTYYTPGVSYYYSPPVSYVAPAVSYYTPSVSYYAAPVGAVTTTRYGILGRPRETTTYYYPR